MPPKKDAPEAKDYFPEVMIFLLALFLLWGAWNRINYYIHTPAGSYVTGLWQKFLSFAILSFWPTFKFIGFLVSIACAIFIAYVWRRLYALVKEDKEMYGAKVETSGGVKVLKNDKWERILTHINSSSAAEWRLAIIEADVMLEELLRSQGYHGDSLGDMLKAVEPSDFLTLDEAWEAHKIRNQIAHTGADYELTEREAKRVVSLFEAVFREFKII